MRRTAVFGVALLLLASSAMAGVEWVSRITSESKGKNTGEITSTVSAQKGDFRQEFANVPKQQSGQYVKDGYWLYKGKERMLYIVDHKQKSITPMSLDALQRMMQALGPMVKITLEDVKTSVKKLAPQKILGFPCNHILISKAYTMKMKVTVIKKTMRIEEEMEVWASTAVPAYSSLNSEFMSREFKTGWEDMDRMIQKQMAAMKNLGFPLKTITHSRQFNKKGKLKSESTSTNEVVKITSKSFPASHFALPEGYQMQENPTMDEMPAEEGTSKKKKKKFKLF